IPGPTVVWTGPIGNAGTHGEVLDVQVANQQHLDSVFFLKPGKGAESCFKADQGVYVAKGQYMTEGQRNTLYGTSHPSLPLTFGACGVFDQVVTPLPDILLNVTFNAE